MSTKLPLNKTEPKKIFVSNDHTISLRDSLVFADGSIQLTLPLASQYQSELRVINTGSGIVTLVRSGNDLIEDGTTIQLTSQNQVISLVSSENTWYQKNKSTYYMRLPDPTDTAYTGLKLGLGIEYKDNTSFRINKGSIHISDLTTSKLCSLSSSLDITPVLQASKQYGIFVSLPDTSAMSYTDITIMEMGTNQIAYDSSRLGQYNVLGSQATGGTITMVGNKTIHTFTSNGTFTPPKNGNVEVLVVAGGGGGGGTGSGRSGGGGGAGGLVYNASFSVAAQPYNVTVGDGGNGGPASMSDGTNGNDSIFSTITAYGGGGGGGGNARTGKNGGSGGGGGGGQFGGGVGGDADYISPRQGYDGGTAIGAWNTDGGGGGGGAGAVGDGGVVNSRAGNGGIGLPFSIAGTGQVYYAGGGGGGVYYTYSAGTGGNGGGGNGGGPGSGGSAGTANTGGGGGGGGSTDGGGATGGKGGSGVVIVSYNTDAISSRPTRERRCIGFIYTDASSQITKFNIFRRTYMLNGFIEYRSQSDGNVNTSLDSTVSVPIGDLLCILQYYNQRYSSNSGSSYIKTYGGSDHYLGQIDGNAVRYVSTITIKCDSAKRVTSSGSARFGTWHRLMGFILPDGI